MESKIHDRTSYAEPVRINKYLASSGICSRREADILIAGGKVTVNGMPAENGMKIIPGQDRVEVNHVSLQPGEQAHCYYLLNKPRGIVTTTKNDPRNVIDYLKLDKRVFPVGRLDMESEGLLLLTDEGALADQLMRARNHHEKEYLVTVDHDITDQDLEKLSQGVWLEELKTKTRPCRIRRMDKRRFLMVLTQGLNRQIRRMCRTAGYRVIRLVRIRILNLTLGDLKPGEYRSLTDSEVMELKRKLGEEN